MLINNHGKTILWSNKLEISWRKRYGLPKMKVEMGLLWFAFLFQGLIGLVHFARIISLCAILSIVKKLGFVARTRIKLISDILHLIQYWLPNSNLQGNPFEFWISTTNIQ